MFLFLSRKIKIKNFKIVSFVFTSLFVLSFAIFSMADEQIGGNKNIFQDTDQDGLSNDEEKLYHTDPNKADTDGDGYSDGTEIKSGYDPLKPAPGDRIMVDKDTSSHSSNIISQNNTDSNKTNLTKEVSKQVAAKLKESSLTKQDISLEDLKNTVQQTVNNSITVDTLPEVDVKSIKIKKQKYTSLSEADRVAKIKEDTIAYVTAVSYLLVSNSPVSVHSDSDAQKFTSGMMDSVVGILTGGNPTLLNELSEKGIMITKQLQSITVPENMLDMHVKALRLVQYATTFKESIESTNTNDPLSQIQTLAKMQGFIGLFSGFTSDMNDILTKYEIQVPLS